MEDVEQQPPRAIVGVDTGGTFTDVTLLDQVTGRIWTAKTPSTPDDPSRGFGNGIAEALTAAGLTGTDIGRVLHGTTVATNLILEGKGAASALITSSGFKFVLEIGRQDVPRRASLFAWVKPKRPVAPEHIFEVGGRIGPDGSEHVTLDTGAVRAAARAIRMRGIGSIAVVLLNSYANPAHERAVAAIVAEEVPGALISLSSEVLPVFREYERSMTTILNATVMPVVASYVDRLDRRMLEQGVAAPLLLMKSSGGVTSAQDARRVPVETALSGPAAGTVGAAKVGAASGHLNLIAIDIGGTSADISLVNAGEPGLTTNGRIGEWPIGLAMVDLVTIGAGGGSIARLSKSGGLTVGPQSAGAVPGPVCYGRGGLEPTVTDAHLALGQLPPYLLGGTFRLDVDAARDAIRKQIAEPLGLGVEAAARGILAIVDNNMVGAIRVVSVERGHDPREFALLPFGGAGPLHGGSLARLLGIPLIVVPPTPGVLSAHGLLVCDLKAEFARTSLQKANGFDVGAVARLFAELEGEALSWLDAEGVPTAARRITWAASMRYQHQGFELNVPWPIPSPIRGPIPGPIPGPSRQVTEASVGAAVAAFHRLHERLYTFAQEDMPVEIVTFRVDARGALPAPTARELPPAGPLEAARTGGQVVSFEAGPVQVSIYARERLGAGARIPGPAILTQFDATTLVLPGQMATVDRFGSLLIAEVDA